MKEECFALRNFEMFYVARNTCYALKDADYRKMKKEGKCGTLECPFYKPKRINVRIGDVIYDTNARKKVVEGRR